MRPPSESSSSVICRRAAPREPLRQQHVRPVPRVLGHVLSWAGGRTGIRTQEGLAPLSVFKTDAFVRSAILPEAILAGPLAGARPGTSPPPLPEIDDHERAGLRPVG